MDKVLTDEIIEEILSMRLPVTSDFQKCSFILPDGRFLKMYEHYEAYKFLVVEGLSPCIPDAEQLLSDFGYIRYSWIGYVTLPDKPLTDLQYKSLELALIQIERFRNDISIQVQSEPKFYVNYSLKDIPYIIKKIKNYYSSGKKINKLTITG